MSTAMIQKPVKTGSSGSHWSIVPQKKMREEVTVSCRKLCHEDLHNMCSSTYINRMVKSMMRWAGQVGCKTVFRNAYKK
jgi:hypothetical protein